MSLFLCNFGCNSEKDGCAATRLSNCRYPFWDLLPIFGRIKIYEIVMRESENSAEMGFYDCENN